MTNRELAALLLRWPDVPACVQVGPMLREVERIRVVNHHYLPPVDDSLFAKGWVIVIDAIDDRSTEVAYTDTLA